MRVNSLGEVPTAEISAIFQGVKHVLKQHLNYEVTSGPAMRHKEAVDSGEISVIVGITGDIKGKLVVGMSQPSAQRIIGRMFGGAPVDSIDEMGWSAFAEFGNWMAAACCNELHVINVQTNITPPLVNEGRSRIHFSDTFDSLPFQFEDAELQVHVIIAA
jgi:chemotaxis protein CheX